MAQTHLYMVFSVRPEVLISRTQGKGMEEKKKSHQMLGRGSQVDSVGIYKANATATLTLGPLNIALFKLKKKKPLKTKNPQSFCKQAYSCPNKHGHRFHPSITWGRRREIRAGIPSGYLLTPRLGVGPGGNLLWSLASWEWEPGGRWSCSEMSDSPQRRPDRTSKIRYHCASVLGGFR